MLQFRVHITRLSQWSPNTAELIFPWSEVKRLRIVQLTSPLAFRRSSILTSCSLAFSLRAAMLELLLSRSRGPVAGGETEDSVEGLGGTEGGVKVGDG